MTKPQYYDVHTAAIIIKIIIRIFYITMVTMLQVFFRQFGLGVSSHHITEFYLHVKLMNLSIVHQI